MSASTSTTTTARPDALPTKSVYFLNVHKFAHPWEHPAVEEVLAALQRKFPDDPAMIVEALRGVAVGGYKITTSSPLEAEATLSVSISGKEHKIPLLPSQGYQGASSSRREGTLVTFLSCTQGGTASIPNDHFDRVMAEHGEVVKPTECQRHRGTSVLNGNRYLVLQPKGTIPPILQIADPKYPGKLFNIRTRYKGQTYLCTKCMEEHSGACPAKKAFYEAQAARASMTIKTQIISDSSLRHVDATGLTADVICMSGGRLGELAHVIHDAPTMQTADQVILLAGVNDILNDDEMEDQFAALTTAAVQHIAAACSSTNKQLTIRDPLCPKGGWVFDRRIRKAELYGEMLKALSADQESPFQYLATNLPVHMQDVHPDAEGVVELLVDLNTYHPGLIWNKNFIVTTKPYQGVTAVYRYGCLLCSRYHDVEDGYCPQCSHPVVLVTDDEMNNQKRERDDDDQSTNKKIYNGPTL